MAWIALYYLRANSFLWANKLRYWPCILFVPPMCRCVIGCLPQVVPESLTRCAGGERMIDARKAAGVCYLPGLPRVWARVQVWRGGTAVSMSHVVCLWQCLLWCPACVGAVVLPAVWGLLDGLAAPVVPHPHLVRHHHTPFTIHHTDTPLYSPTHTKTREEACGAVC